MATVPQTPITVISTSKLFAINWNDFLKGLIMAVGGAVFTVIENSIEANNFTFNWTNIWHIALGAFVLYLGKNFFTPSSTTVSGMAPGTTAVITVPEKGTSIAIPTPPSNQKPPTDPPPQGPIYPHHP
jgi:hypothetical protein